MHSYAVETAMDDTNDATYQAMEALIHNLNTMNSRAGAQVPFSSLNYGTDTSPEGRMAMKNTFWQQKKDWEAEKLLFSLSKSSKSKKALAIIKKTRTMTYSSYPFVFPQNVFSLTLALLMLRLIYNIIKRDILRLKLHIWAAVPE